MKKNEGLLDRIIRFLVAIVIGVLFFAHVISGTIGIILLIVAVLFLVTSLMGTCFVYAMFGIGTCENAEKTEEEE